MNSMEVDMMIGMVSILNEASKSYHTGHPIISDAQYDIRLNDLRQFEEETGFMLLNSPNCKLDLQSVVKFNMQINDSTISNNVDDIIAFAGQNEMLVYSDFNGMDMYITYVDGVLSNIYINNNVFNIKNISNIPYKINKDGVYVVYGKVASSDKLKFIVSDVAGGSHNSSKDNLEEVQDLGFDIVNHWLAPTLPETLQKSIDYVFNLENDLPCIGVVFKFNNVEYCNSVNNDRIIYKSLDK